MEELIERDRKRERGGDEKGVKTKEAKDKERDGPLESEKERMMVMMIIAILHGNDVIYRGGTRT